MTLKDVGTFLIGKGLPFVGSLVGGRAGESIGQGIAELLGVENRPDAIIGAIEKNPEALVKIREYETSLAIAQLKNDEAHTVQASENIRAEAESGDLYTKQTRPRILRQSFYLWAFMVAGGFLAIMVLVLKGVDKKILDLIVDNWRLVIRDIGALVMVGFTGYTYMRSSRDKAYEAGQAPRGFLDGVLKTIKR